jgi:HPt (histidine-containing phosphotransfer) domain-containing protein
MESRHYAPRLMLDLPYLHKNYVATGLGGVLPDVLQTFQNQARHNLQSIQRACAASNFSGIGQAAHSLRGAAGSVGAFRLADGAEELEDAVEQNDAAAAARLCAELAHLTNATLEAISLVLAQPQNERWPAPF